MPKFEAWWDKDEGQGEEPIFPKVEELEIQHCGSLTALPKAASVGVDTNKCRSAFPASRKMKLHNLNTFHKWEEVEGTVGEEVAFPWLEELSICSCRSLTTLPKGSLLVKQSFGGAEISCSSAFPALRKLRLYNLSALEKLVVEGTQGEEVTFPLLEELSIVSCRRLSALPKGPFVKQSFVRAEMTMTDKLIQGEKVTFPWLQKLSIWVFKNLSALSKGSLLVKQSFVGPETVWRCSAFPSPRKLDLHSLSALERWGAVEGTFGEEVTLFPLLEVLTIYGCPMLSDLPEAPKLSVLTIQAGQRGQQISLQAAGRYIPSLSSLSLTLSPNDSETTLLHATQKWNHKLPLAAMRLTSCDLVFSSLPSALSLWTCFTQLVDLSISECYSLVYWPENVFQVLVSLRKLSIVWCRYLTGRTQASDEQSGPAPEQGGHLPRLESVFIDWCASLVEVPNLPASLRTLCISRSRKLKSIIFDQQEDTRLVSGEGVVQPDTSSLILGSSSSEATTSTHVWTLSSAANHHFLPCLESLSIMSCGDLSEVANLPRSIKTLHISSCKNLQSLSGQLGDVQKLTIKSCNRLESLGSCLGKLRSLVQLELSSCKNLVSLPDRSQAYSSLRFLRIKKCDGIKLLPRSLQSGLDCLEEKDLDACHEEPKTRTRAIRRMVDQAAMKWFPCSRDESDSESGSD